MTIRKVICSVSVLPGISIGERCFTCSYRCASRSACRLNLCCREGAACCSTYQIRTKHSIIIDVTGSDVKITADKQMLEELIYNLCDNAIRYNNPGGKVKVSVYTRQNNGVTENVLEVADNGI